MGGYFRISRENPDFWAFLVDSWGKIICDPRYSSIMTIVYSDRNCLKMKNYLIFIAIVISVGLVGCSGGSGSSSDSMVLPEAPVVTNPEPIPVPPGAITEPEPMPVPPVVEVPVEAPSEVPVWARRKEAEYEALPTMLEAMLAVENEGDAYPDAQLAVEIATDIVGFVIELGRWNISVTDANIEQWISDFGIYYDIFNTSLLPFNTSLLPTGVRLNRNEIPYRDTGYSFKGTAEGIASKDNAFTSSPMDADVLIELNTRINATAGVVVKFDNIKIQTFSIGGTGLYFNEAELNSDGSFSAVVDGFSSKHAEGIMFGTVYGADGTGERAPDEVAGSFDITIDDSADTSPSGFISVVGRFKTD